MVFFYSNYRYSNLTSDIPFRFGKNESGEYGYIVTDSEGADTIIPFKKGIVPMTFLKTEAYSTTDTTYFGESYVYSIDNFKSMTISVTNVQTAYNFSVTVSGKKADGTSKTPASKGWNTSSLGSTTVDISEYVTISVHINQTSGSRPAKRYSISFS